MPFQKGMPRPANAGRKKGSQNYAQGDVQAFARRILDDPEYQANLLRRAIAGELAPGMETLLFHYAHGKPAEAARDDQAFMNALLEVVLDHVHTADGKRAIRGVIDTFASGAPSAPLRLIR